MSFDWGVFENDVLPDATWGLCGGHKQHPKDQATIVRLVDENGNFAAGGMCQICWEEMKNANVFPCPEHGIQPKAPGGGCPVAGCMGTSSGPTQDEIEREAESLGSVWPGGPPKLENVVAAPTAEPESGRDREVVESSPGPAGILPEHDGRGVDEGQQWRDPFLIEEG